MNLFEGRNVATVKLFDLDYQLATVVNGRVISTFSLLTVPKPFRAVLRTALQEKYSPKEHHMKVSVQEVEASVAKETYTYDGMLTICVITMQNGYKVVGTSACVDPTEYDQETGKSIARQRAIDGVWPLLGFALAETMHAVPKPPKTYAEQAGVFGEPQS